MKKKVVAGILSTILSIPIIIFVLTNCNKQESFISNNEIKPIKTVTFNLSGITKTNGVLCFSTLDAFETALDSLKIKDMNDSIWYPADSSYSLDSTETAYVLRDFEESYNFYSFRRYNNDLELDYLDNGQDFRDTLFPNDEYIRTLLSEYREIKIGSTIYKYVDHNMVFEISNSNWDVMTNLRNQINLSDLVHPDLEIKYLSKKASDLDANIKVEREMNGDEMDFVFSTVGSVPTGCSYYWDFGDASYSTQAEPTHSYSSGGTYTVTLVIADGNKVYQKVTIVLNASTDCNAIAYFTHSTTDNGDGTYTVDFVAICSPSTGATASSWFWTFDDDNNNSSTLINPSHTFSAPGKYTVTLTFTDSKGCIAYYPWKFELGCDEEYCKDHNKHPDGYGYNSLNPNGKIYWKGWIEYGGIWRAYGSKTKYYEKQSNGKWKRRKADEIECGNDGELYDDECCTHKRTVTYATHKDVRSNRKEVRYSWCQVTASYFSIDDDMFYTKNSAKKNGIEISVTVDIND